MRLWSDEIEALRPEAQKVIAEGMDFLLEMLGRDDEPPATDQAARVAAMRAAFSKVYAPVPEAEDREIAGVRCRVIRSEGPTTAVYLHFHGGAMVIGAPEVNDISNLDLARRFGMTVVSVDYRKAPEHPYPAGPDDGVAVARWLVEHAEDEFGSARLLTGGESAGAYMAAAVLLRVRDELGAIERFEGANLVFGVYDWGKTPSQRGIRYTESPDILDTDQIRFITDCYLPGRTDDERRDPAISPLFADLRGLPRAFMSVGTADHLADDTLMLAPRWAAAGNKVELFVAPDMPHAFMGFPCGITDAWWKTMFDWFADVLAREPTSVAN